MDSHQEHILLEQVLRDLRVSREISRDNWMRLKKRFGERFDKAWRLVIENRVKKYVFSPSGRVLWIVVGQTAEYLIYSNAGYCGCSDFYFRVLNDEKAYCYHLLAQKLADALNHYELVREDDEAYESLLGIWKEYCIQD